MPAPRPAIHYGGILRTERCGAGTGPVPEKVQYGRSGVDVTREDSERALPPTGDEKSLNTAQVGH